MDNPWKYIRLSDYENHMRSDTVMQLQTLNEMMKKQLSTYSVKSVMILGIAGGNGLEHINPDKYSTVYAVDINPEYLREVKKRYADLIIANLLIEYIGYECFRTVVKQVKPKYVSCGIQINTDSEFVSDSPYIHAFDGLNSVHHQMDSTELMQAMDGIGYKAISAIDYLLPNGNKLVQIDYRC